MKPKEIKKFIIRQLVDIILTLALSLLITYIFSGKQLFTNFSSVYKNVLFGFCIGYTLWKGNQFIGWIGDIFFPWEKNPKRTLFVNSILSITFTTIDIFVVNYLYLKFVFDVDMLDNPSRWIWQMIISFLISMLITIDRKSVV